MENTKKSMTYKEYCNFILNEINNINVCINNKIDENNNFKKFCSVKESNQMISATVNLDDMYNYLKDPIKRNIIINALKVVFGKDFFTDFSEEKYKEYKEKGLFCKRDIDTLLKGAYKNFYGYTFKRPNSYDELALFLLNCFNIFKNNSIENDAKKNYIAIIFGFKALIENKCMDCIVKKREALFILDKYNEFINAYRELRKINIKENDYDFIKFVLNKDNREFVDLRDGTEKRIGLGDAFLIFVSDYNAEYKNINKQRYDSKTILKADNYYKKIKRINVEDLENKYLPKYSNKNFVDIMKKLISNFEEDLNKDESYLQYYTLLMAHYASFYKSKYYKDNNDNTIKFKG